MNTTITDNTLAVLLPPIARNAYKYTRGSLLVLAGSNSFPGAAVLAAQAAARGGAGYVTLAIPETVAAIAQAHLLSVPVIAAPATKGAFAADAWKDVCAQATHVDAIVLGPGLTVTSSTSAFVEVVLREATVPVLVDADALNILAACWAQSGVVLPFASGVQTGSASTSASNFGDCTPSAPASAADPCYILTPHAGELKRLLDATGLADVQCLANALNAVVVAKGPETSIVSPTQMRSVSSGTPALAKAGTGDVLSGLIGSLVAQGASPFMAAVAGVELHARAGRIAERLFSRRSVCAEDVIQAVPHVLRELEG
ncbi:MAG: NAD(P)H-hydrate dehydratase [Coriobacteriales bacterium]|jgi:NAD(P)H-hydrate epimerase|nr:NAD(P)H-hydrate dehydratase [Coriobacteriales bacterium]